MAGVVDAGAWAEKMLRKVGQSAQDWENGVKNPSTSPVAAMRKAKGRFKDEMTKALAEGRWDGTIIDAPRGSGGFGYDPFFLDPESGMTGAELPPEQKNARSHRGKAMRALIARLGQET